MNRLLFVTQRRSHRQLSAKTVATSTLSLPTRKVQYPGVGHSRLLNYSTIYCQQEEWMDIINNGEQSSNGFGLSFPHQRQMTIPQRKMMLKHKTRKMNSIYTSPSISPNEAFHPHQSNSKIRLYTTDSNKIDSEQELTNLSTQTIDFLKSFEATTNTDELLSLLYKWDKIITSFAEEYNKQQTHTHELEDTHPKSKQQAIMVTSAKHMEDLLEYYIRHHIETHKKKEQTTKPFSVVMNAWNHCTECTYSGYKASSALSSWGKFYDGDLSLAPNIHDFNIVLDAYSKSSSHLLHLTIDESSSNGTRRGSSGFITLETETLPVVRAWKIYNILKGVERLSLSLQMNATSYYYLSEILMDHIFMLQHAQLSSDNSSAYMNEDLYQYVDHAPMIWKKLMVALPKSSWTTLVEGLTTKKEQEKPLRYIKSFDRIIQLSSMGLFAKDLSTVGVETENLVQEFLRILPQKNSDNASIQHFQSAFYSVMDAWLTEQGEIIGQMKKHAAEDDNESSVDPDPRNYRQMIDALCRATLSIDNLLHQMNTEMGMIPQPEHYHAAIKAYANLLDRTILSFDNDDKILTDLGPSITCSHLLKEAENAYQVGKTSDENGPLLTSSLYEQVLKAKHYEMLQAPGKESSLAMAEDAEEILQRMEHRLRTTQLDVDSNMTNAYNRILAIYSLSDGTESMERALLLVKNMKQLRQNIDSFDNEILPTPDSKTYGLLLKILSRSGDRRAAKLSLDILEQEVQVSENFEPNLSHYKPIVMTLSKEWNQQLIEKAIDIMNQIDDMYHSLPEDEREHDDYDPVKMYTEFLTNYYYSRKKGSRYTSSQALELLQKIEDKYEETMDPRYKPDMMLYSSVISALSVDKMSDDVSTSHALDILDKLEKGYREGNSVLPNRFVFTTVMRAVVNTHKEDAVEEVEHLLKRMYDLYEYSQDESVKPDVICITEVIKAWGKSKLPEAKDRIVELFKRMEDEASKGDLQMKPSAITYTVVMNALAKQGKAEEVEQLIKVMDERHADGDWDMKPDTYVFTSAMNAWGRSERCDKAERAWELFLNMKDRYDKGDLSAKPNTICLTSVINTCGYIPRKCNRQSKRKALEIALMAFQHLTENPGEFGYANSVTFKTMLLAMGNLAADQREKDRYGSIIFKKCCEHGTVNIPVVMMVKRYYPELYKGLPLDFKGRVDFHKMPKAWYKRAKLPPI